MRYCRLKSMRPSVLRFLVLVFVLSVPFWLLGALTDLELLPGLPVAGWDYAVDPIQARTSALTAGLVLGGAWAVWHLVPLVQAHRPPAWMAWWALGTVANRVIIVRLYNNTGKSVSAAVVYHASPNMGWQLFPNYGSHYDPRVTSAIVACLAVIVTAVLGPRTLARFSRERTHAAAP